MWYFKIMDVGETLTQHDISISRRYKRRRYKDKLLHFV